MSESFPAFPKPDAAAAPTPDGSPTTSPSAPGYQCQATGGDARQEQQQAGTHPDRQGTQVPIQDQGEAAASTPRNCQPQADHSFVGQAPAQQPGYQTPYSAVQSGYQMPDQAQYQMPYQLPAYASAPTAPASKTLGIIAFVVALAGTLLGAIPTTMVLGWPLLIAAFVLAIVAIAKKSAQGLAIGGLIISMLGSLLSAGVLVYSALEQVRPQFVSDTESEEAFAWPTDEEQLGSGDDDTFGHYGPESFKDGVYDGQGITITITGHRVIKPGETGNQRGDAPLIVFDFTITNNEADMEVTPSVFAAIFEAYQDNNPNFLNSLEWGYEEGSSEKYGDLGFQTLKQGGSVDYSIAYELSDMTTPVELVATSFAGEEIGKMTIPIEAV